MPPGRRPGQPSTLLRPLPPIGSDDLEDESDEEPDGSKQGWSCLAGGWLWWVAGSRARVFGWSLCVWEGSKRGRVTRNWGTGWNLKTHCKTPIRSYQTLVVCFSTEPEYNIPTYTYYDSVIWRDGSLVWDWFLQNHLYVRDCWLLDDWTFQMFDSACPFGYVLLLLA